MKSKSATSATVLVILDVDNYEGWSLQVKANEPPKAKTDEATNEPPKAKTDEPANEPPKAKTDEATNEPPKAITDEAANEPPMNRQKIKHTTSFPKPEPKRARL